MRLSVTPLLCAAALGCYTQSTPDTSPAAVLAGFRADFYRCLIARAEALFELTDALLCTDGPVTSLVDLTLAPEYRRGHGALYDGLNSGRLDVARFRMSLAALP